VTERPDRTERWYWCLRHQRPEREGEQCRAQDHLGPYPSREEALRWRERVEARNLEWESEDRRWEDEE
jgi:hypothetical protein